MYTYGGYATQRGACLWPSLRRAWVAPALSLLLSWLSCASLLVVCCIPCRCFPHVISWLFFKWFLSRRDGGSAHGNICSNTFQSKQQMALLLPFDLAGKIPFQWCWLKFQAAWGNGVHEHLVLPFLSTVALLADVCSSTFYYRFFPSYYYFLLPWLVWGVTVLGWFFFFTTRVLIITAMSLLSIVFLPMQAGK